jgi:hypothetical protein
MQELLTPPPPTESAKDGAANVCFGWKADIRIASDARVEVQSWMRLAIHLAA